MKHEAADTVAQAADRGPAAAEVAAAGVVGASQRRGRFQNRYPHAHHGFAGFWRMLRAYRQATVVPVTFASVGNDPQWLARNRHEDSLTWVGHDTFVVQWGGLNLITDPHFSERASPVSFAGPKRWAAPGLGFEQLPPMDVVLVSHNHYDHLDAASVMRLAREHPGAHFIVPRGLRRWFVKRGAERVIELDWWQAVEVAGCRVTAVPAQHFSGRGLRDRNRVLWCGFVVERAGRRLYFAGDTGYSRDFADIGARFAPVDLALLPIGAYEPRWFMQSMHVNPEDAVKIHRDIGARLSVAMHWGTFRLTTEPMDEPPRRLAAARAAAGLTEDAFRVLAHGQTIRLGSAERGQVRAAS